MHEQTVRCPICSGPYKVYAFKAGDQSACPECVAEAERRYRSPTDFERSRRDMRRKRHFDGA